MSDLYQSLSHSKWDCKYHVVFRSQEATAGCSSCRSNAWDLLTPPKLGETKWQRCPHRLIAIAHAIVLSSDCVRSRFHRCLFLKRLPYCPACPTPTEFCRV